MSGNKDIHPPSKPATIISDPPHHLKPPPEKPFTTWRVHPK